MAVDSPEKLPPQLVHFLDGLPVAQATFGAILGICAANIAQKQASVYIATAFRAATGGASGGAHSCSLVEYNSIDNLQDFLDLCKANVQGDRVNVTQAKKLLRDLGRHSLASRLGKLSKMRNGSAHPDKTLLKEVQALLSDPDVNATGKSLRQTSPDRDS